MANPFTSSSGKNNFDIVSESLDAGEYIQNKKAKATFCKTYNCTPNIKVGSQSNFLLYKKANYFKIQNILYNNTLYGESIFK